MSSQPLAAGYASRFNTNKIAAFILWLVSVYSTSVLIEALRSGVSLAQYVSDTTIGGLVGSVSVNSLLSALIFQFLLTICEQSIWRGRGVDVIAGFALALDVGTNMTSAFPLTRNFGKTAIWDMLVAVFGLQISWGVFGAFILALGWGVFAAGGPEKLWSRR